MKKIMFLIYLSFLFISYAFSSVVDTNDNDVHFLKEKDRHSGNNSIRIQENDKVSLQEKKSDNMILTHKCKSKDNDTIKLNSQMMFDGPKGGIQNNKPRGIGM